MRFKLNERSKLRNDLYRKIPHILIFIGLFVVWYIGMLFVKNSTGTTRGMIPFENNMLYLYFKLLNEQNSTKIVLLSLGWFYYLLFFFFYSLFLCMLANEYTRKSKKFFFPFNIFCSILLCEEEKNEYGTYLYFAIGQLFASLLCPPMVLFTVLGISSIADLMTSQIGIKFGRSNIKWNEDKTWEGALAGIVGCYFISLFFMGLLWAIIFTVGFFLFDILTRKPINISDNLLVPIGLAIIFVVIRYYFNLDYYTIIITWI
jgi:dolichol kinase